MGEWCERQDSNSCGLLIVILSSSLVSCLFIACTSRSSLPQKLEAFQNLFVFANSTRSSEGKMLSRFANLGPNPMMNSTKKPAVRDMPDWMTTEHSTGTTIMACEFDGGVVIGADSRTTTGIYVANRVTDKLTRVTDRIYCCRSGSAADTQAITDVVAYHLEFHEIERGEPAQVKEAATIFQNLCYNYRDQMSAGIIVAGWDSRLGGQVYSVPIGGMRVRQEVCIGGSGSGFIYGFVDSNFKPKMNREQAEDFVTRAVTLALNRDGSSGGCVRIGTITKDGLERKVVLNNELPRFYEG